MECRIDTYDQQHISGWAWNRAEPNEILVLQIRTSGGRSKLFSADQYRADIEQAGIGNGKHAFNVSFKEWELTDETISVHTLGRTSAQIGPSLKLNPISILKSKSWAGNFSVTLCNELQTVHDVLMRQSILAHS